MTFLGPGHRSDMDTERWEFGATVERICRRCRQPFEARGEVLADPDPWCAACLERETPPDRRLVCRDCGVEFYLAWNEVHPDCCWPCLQQRIHRTAEAIRQDEVKA